MPTAMLTTHARERAAELGVCTKRIKRIVREADVCRVTRGEGRRIAVMAADPELAVVYVVGADGRPIVVTVLYRDPEQYQPSQQH